MKDNNNIPTVSIVIVCMNNLKNLYPCLQSIRKYTHVSYECFVVAYLFTKENLAKVRKDFPWVKIIESNEIRGFSENNNLALRRTMGRYCFVLNDDTEMKMPVADLLVEDFQKVSNNVAVISPKTIFPDGSLQSCGRPPITWIKHILSVLHFWNESKPSLYTCQKGLFKSYNIVGAAFLIRRDIFKQYGWFDEQYFFCPEDIAIGTTLNKNNYYCYVDADIEIVHYEGMSGKSESMTQTATKPAALRGGLLYYNKGNCIKMVINQFLCLFVLSFHLFYHSIRAKISREKRIYEVLSKADLNCIKICFSHKTPKEIFIKYYKKLDK